MGAAGVSRSMTWKLRLLRNFPGGIFLGSLLGICLCWMVVGNPVLAALIQFPTLLTGLVAVGAAAIALTGSLSTVENQNSIAEDARVAKLTAARAALPLALSEIMQVAENRVQYAIDRNPVRRNADWSFSETTHKTLKECIELARGPVQSALAEMILIYQVLVARELSSDGVVGGSLLSLGSLTPIDRYSRFHEVANWETVATLAEMLFPFARGSSGTFNRSELSGRAISRLDRVVVRPSGLSIRNAEGFSEWFRERRNMGHLAFSRENWQNND